MRFQESRASSDCTSGGPRYATTGCHQHSDRDMHTQRLKERKQSRRMLQRVPHRSHHNARGRTGRA